LPLFGITEPLRRRRWTEVGGPIAPSRSWSKAAASGGARTEPASTEAPATGARPAEAAWTRTTEAAGAARPRWRAIFAGSCFADRQVSTLERLGIEFPHDLVGERAVGKLDEGEATRSAGLPVDGHDDVGRFRDGCEVSSKISLSRAVRQVSDKQTDCQCSS